MKKQVILDYETLTLDELSDEERELRDAALHASSQAYAPYSGFQVGTALRLADGTIVCASNKENASFPAGVCAERNALNYAHDHHPGVSIASVSIIAVTDRFELSHPIAPCGICRQVLCETERMQGVPMQIMLHDDNSNVVKLSSAADLLPFHFYLPELKK